MTKQTKRRFTPAYKEQAVERLSEPGATPTGVAAELGVTPTQLTSASPCRTVRPAKQSPAALSKRGSTGRDGWRGRGRFGNSPVGAGTRLEPESGLDLAPLITHRLGIDDFAEGFEVMRSGKSGKVVMDW